jgi:hypothetical protein
MMMSFNFATVDATGRRSQVATIAIRSSLPVLFGVTALTRQPAAGEGN